MKRINDPLTRALALTDAIEAAADDIERKRRIPTDVLSKLHNARLYRMFLPHTLDGDEVDPGTYLRTIETIARSDGSIAWNLFVGNSAALISPHLAPVTARTIFSPANALVAWGPPNANVATTNKNIAINKTFRVEK